MIYGSFMAHFMVFSHLVLETPPIPEASPSKKGDLRLCFSFKRYLENDRKVLRFYTFWDESGKYGSRKYYTMHYYLADDTVELLENLPRSERRRLRSFLKGFQKGF